LYTQESNPLFGEIGQQPRNPKNSEQNLEVSEETDIEYVKCQTPCKPQTTKQIYKDTRQFVR